MINNAFTDTLREIRSGHSLSELSEKLTEVVAAVRKSGKAGKLTYELTIKPASRGETVTLMAQDKIKVSLPENERAASIFFSTDENSLMRTDPRQKEFELKTVPVPEAVEMRQVAN